MPMARYCVQPIECRPAIVLRRSSIYAMFDLLMLLSEGRTMYFGPAWQAVRRSSFLSTSPVCLAGTSMAVVA